MIFIWYCDHQFNQQEAIMSGKSLDEIKIALENLDPEIQDNAVFKQLRDDIQYDEQKRSTDQQRSGARTAYWNTQKNNRQVEDAQRTQEKDVFLSYLGYKVDATNSIYNTYWSYRAKKHSALDTAYQDVRNKYWSDRATRHQSENVDSKKNWLQFLSPVSVPVSDHGVDDFYCTEGSLQTVYFRRSMLNKNNDIHTALNRKQSLNESMDYYVVVKHALEDAARYVYRTIDYAYLKLMEFGWLLSDSVTYIYRSTGWVKDSAVYGLQDVAVFGYRCAGALVDATAFTVLAIRFAPVDAPRFVYRSATDVNNVSCEKIADATTTIECGFNRLNFWAEIKRQHGEKCLFNDEERQKLIDAAREDIDNSLGV